jgi:hypothetical protein
MLDSFKCFARLLIVRRDGIMRLTSFLADLFPARTLFFCNLLPRLDADFVLGCRSSPFRWSQKFLLAYRFG